MVIAVMAMTPGDRGTLGGPAAVAARDGVTLRLELERDAITPGDLLWGTLPVLVRGGADLYVSAGAASDRAFDDGRLARWLEARPTPAMSGAGGVGDIVGGIKLEGDIWRVLAAQKTLLPDYRSSEIEVRLDARDGKVVSVVER